MTAERALIASVIVCGIIGFYIVVSEPTWGAYGEMFMRWWG